MVRDFDCHEVDQAPILQPLREEAANLVKQNEIINEERAGVQSGKAGSEVKEGKKAFVEPVISVPVDVLEATTFFQVATSGATN